MSSCNGFGFTNDGLDGLVVASSKKLSTRVLIKYMFLVAKATHYILLIHQVIAPVIAPVIAQVIPQMIKEDFNLAIVHSLLMITRQTLV